VRQEQELILAPNNLLTDLEQTLKLPFIARRIRAWEGIAVEWERVAPFELEPQGYPEHRIGLVLNRCSELIRKEDGLLHKLSIERGDLFIAPAGQEIGYRWNSQLELVSLLLEPAFLEEIAARTMDLDGSRVELIGQAKFRDPLVSAIALTLHRELECESPGSRLLVDSLTQALAVHLLRVHASFPVREIKGSLPRWRLRRALAYIEEHLSENISLAQLAEAAGNVSRYHFARLFKQSTGYSPYRYLVRRRIRQAQSMLRGQKRISMGEIAFFCGFGDQSTFSRVFRQVTGCTPKAYRDG
jgi:AraC family transcriptional regulator